MVKYFIPLIIALGLSLPSQADDRFSGVDGLEQAYRMLQLMKDANYELMTLWINCELDNLCVCESKAKLYETTKNFALKVMIESEREQDAARCEKMKEDAQFCRVPVIQDVNKALIPCYERFRDSAYYNDKTMHESAALCLTEQLQPLLAQENPYAMYVFIDFLSANRESYPGLLEYYEQKLDTFKNTQDFKTIQQCYDFIKN